MSIQMSHHVPCPNSEPLRVRTGYEAVIAQNVSRTFAATAGDDGVVEEIDPALGLLKLRYGRAPNARVDVIKLGDAFTNISGSYLKQTMVANVKKGDRVKKGDVVAYNEGFFSVNPDDPRQVNWNHGVLTNVALIEMPETYEDSCAISKALGQKLTMGAGHLRVITMTNNTVIYDIVKEGQHVETTDYLCTLEDSDLDAVASVDDPETMEFIAAMNRKNPRAKYHGVVAKIEFYHACPFQDLHPSLKKIARLVAEREFKLHTAAKGSTQEHRFLPPQQVPIGTRYQGVDFVDETVVALLITISEDSTCGTGDKLVVMNANKSVVSTVLEQPVTTESGETIDMLFGGSSISNRIVLSPTIVGIATRCMMDLEKEVIRQYFDEKK